MDIKNNCHGANVCHEKYYYKQKIVDIVDKIGDERYIKMIYGFVSQMHKNETGD